MYEFYFFLDVLKAFFVAFLIIVIVREIVVFIFEIVYFYITDKKGKKLSKFYGKYKFLDFSGVFLGKIIKF